MASDVARFVANGSAAPPHSAADRLEEAVGLARAIALDVRAAELVPVARPRPATLLGSGKVQEIAQRVAEHEAGLVIVDHAVSPIQQRNLERAWDCKVLDRTGLILEIFGERAITREGRLQVELAHLNYQKSRLVRSWTHLERQRGGFGFLGGPGEAQIETDRRLIEERIEGIRRDLGGVVKTRTLRMRSASTTSSSVARKAATSVVGRLAMKPTVSDSMMRRPLASFTSRMVGSRVSNTWSRAATAAPVKRLKSVDLPALV